MTPRQHATNGARETQKSEGKIKKNYISAQLPHAVYLKVHGKDWGTYMYISINNMRGKTEPETGNKE